MNITPQVELHARCVKCVPALSPRLEEQEFREGVKAALADLQKMGYIREIGVNGKDGQ